MDKIMEEQIINSLPAVWGYILVGLFSFLGLAVPAYIKGRSEIKNAVNDTMQIILNESRKQTQDARTEMERMRQEHRQEVDEIKDHYQTKIDELEQRINDLQRRQNDMSEPM